MSIRVLVVDDREVVHYGVRLLLSVRNRSGRCIGAASAHAAVALLGRYDFDVALVDHVVGDESGLAISGRLHRAAPALRILLMNSGAAPPPRALAYAGVCGCVNRNDDGRGLLEALECATCGLELPRLSAPAGLSAREVEILDGLARGWTNAQIAEALFLSQDTVKHYTRAVYRKLKARNRANAVLRAQQLGLVA